MKYVGLAEPNSVSASETDSTPPTVQAFEVSPIPHSLNLGETFSIDYTVLESGGSGLKQVELWRKNETSGWQEIKPPNILTGKNGPVSGSFTDSPSTPGKYWYGVHVVDYAGNWNDQKNSNSNEQPNSFEPVEVEVENAHDTSNGGLMRTLEGYSCIAFSPDGRTLASGSDDTTVKLWDTSNGALIRTLKGHSSDVNGVAFSPDDRTLASGSSDNTVKLWDASNGALIQTLEGHAYYVNSVAFSPDGHTLASGSSDNTVKLWDTSNGAFIRTLEGHAYYVRSVAFSPDGRTLASVDSGGTLSLCSAA